MIRVTTAILLMTGLAACGGPGTQPANDASQAGAGNDAALNYQAEILDLSPGQRDTVMIRAIRDAGIECQQVRASEQIRGEGLTYRASCDDGRQHVIAIASDGNAKVISAAPSKRS